MMPCAKLSQIAQCGPDALQFQRCHLAVVGRARRALARDGKIDRERQQPLLRPVVEVTL